MKVVITPGFSELFIVVNPVAKITRDGLLTINMPWLYAPWPDARQTGVIETEVEGDTLRALLGGLAEAYNRAGVDFQPINPRTNDMDEDYDAWINDTNYVAIPDGLNARLKDGDRVKVKILWRWDG